MGDMSVQRSIRFPDELAAAIALEAEAADRSFAWVVVRAVEDALQVLGPTSRRLEKALAAKVPSARGPGDMGPAPSKGRRDESPSSAPVSSRASVEPSPEFEKLKAGYEKQLAEPQLLKCPRYGCSFTAKSPAAQCPDHGYKVR